MTMFTGLTCEVTGTSSSSVLSVTSCSQWWRIWAKDSASRLLRQPDSSAQVAGEQFTRDVDIDQLSADELLQYGVRAEPWPVGRVVARVLANFHAERQR